MVDADDRERCRVLVVFDIDGDGGVGESSVN